MWQRFQTLLLLICAGLLVSMFSADMCYVMVPDAGDTTGELTRFAIKFVNRSHFIIFTFVTMALCIIAIFYYKARLLQIRICIINILLLLAYQIWILVYFFEFKKIYTFTVPSLFPFACIVLLLIAIRYIWRDESEVIAYNIIRKNKKNGKIPPKASK
ncbi:MAG: DUF4293 family protein [Bacteroidales bacterium]|nr:DUF4293 family protein [Bacteroidales bacterium]MBO7480324.1 DUF4293 family protein [Bacteroidales bacterium]MBO7487175.1 DUF4293 family protein [Bacteroidales bacterium]